MKNIKTIGLAGLAAALLFASCSVEKRHYNKGFHVQWNNKAPKATEQATNNTKPAATTATENTAAVNTVAQEAPATLSASAQAATPVTAEKTVTTTVKAKQDIKNPTKVNETKAYTKAAVVKAKEIAKTTGGKSQVIALILCCLGFVIIGGLHRFYLGYIGIGIIQLLTGGGCLIWTIIDLVRILSGELGPKDGSGYTETL